LRGETIADFVALVKAGSVYLNVGTSAHPLGEIRGQLE
jgi:CHRD domain